MQTRQITSISSINVNKTNYIDILHKCKQKKIHRYPTKTKQNTLIPYININKQNTSISYININTTKYMDILHKQTKYMDILQT